MMVGGAVIRFLINKKSDGGLLRDSRVLEGAHVSFRFHYSSSTGSFIGIGKQNEMK